MCAYVCAGRRRLELFGEEHNIRPGWVTVGDQITSSNFNKQVGARMGALQSCLGGEGELAPPQGRGEERS